MSIGCRLAIVLGVTVLLAAACASGGGSGGGVVGGAAGAGGTSSGGASTMTSTEACKARFTAVCDRLYGCFTSDQLKDLEQAGSFTDATSCAKSFSDDTCPDIKTAVDKATVTFNPSNVASCKSQTTATACGADLLEFIENSRKLASCANVFNGKVKKLGDCSISTECKGKDAQCAGNKKCTAALSGDSFEKECSEKTVETCDGLVCLTLKPNKQNMTGICTARCSGDWDCGAGGKCVAMPDKSQLCVSVCQSAADCGGGFLCQTFFDDGTKACFIEVN